MRLFKAGLTVLLVCVSVLTSTAAEPSADNAPEIQRIADGIKQGHVHPALCVAKSGAVLAAHFDEYGGKIFLLRSKDGAQTWEPPIAPPACPGELNRDVFGKIIPAYNRGALCEGRDGRLF